MLRSVLNYINKFRAANRIKKLKLNFFSDGKVNSLNEIKNLEEKRRIAKKIKNFLKNCDLFYENLNINSNLKIGGLWKDYLKKAKKDQLSIYKKGDEDEILMFHENMFYNCSIRGLWNYSYFDTVKSDHSSNLLFLKDMELYKIIFRNFTGLPSSNKINKWGYRQGDNRFHFLDLSSNLQKNLIINSLNIFNKQDHNVLEIGGGFGSLGERLFESEKINSYTDFDIPTSLLTTYYYLALKFGEEKVELIDNIKTMQSKLKPEQKKIYLIPSAFFSEIKNYDNYDLLCNFASFSEMDLETIKYYLHNLPKSIKSIVTGNSNLEIKYDDNNKFEEVMLDNFPIPREFVLCFSNVQTPFYSNWRNKTQVWYKKKEIHSN